MRFYEVADSEILLDSESSLDSILGLPVKISCAAHSLEMSLGGCGRLKSAYLPTQRGATSPLSHIKQTIRRI